MSDFKQALKQNLLLVYGLWSNTDGSDMYPDSKVPVANTGPTWVLAAPGGPHIGPMNLAIRVDIQD